MNHLYKCSKQIKLKHIKINCFKQDIIQWTLECIFIEKEKFMEEDILD